MTEAQRDAKFAALDAHLDDVWPIIRTFCLTHDFIHVRTGRYPRIQIRRHRAVNIGFELGMEPDPNGKSHETYTPERTYYGWSGVCVDTTEDGLRVRYSSSGLLFEHVPFPCVPAILVETLDTARQFGEAWTVDELRARGTRTVMTRANGER
ncbi:MAG: hypothetical protein QM831_08160 [Kofleriaceae bacterium]